MDNDIIGHHISKPFNKELEDIRQKVLLMNELVEQQIVFAIEAFSTGNLQLAKKVIKKGNDVDVLEASIDHECTQILALRQPTAIDLRLLITVFKIIHELESTGKEAERIAEMAIELSTTGNNTYHYELEHIAIIARKMLSDALKAFADMTLDNIPDIIEQHNNVNREYDNILRQLISQMIEDPRNISQAIDVIWVVRAIEKIADHACYICDHIFYMHKSKFVHYSNKLTTSS